MSTIRRMGWPGKSERKYEYSIHKLGTSLEARPGNYIFAKETQPRRWTPCYIGQTDNLKERLRDHEKEASARSHGATHIHVHANDEAEAIRRAEEADLIKKWNPPCNRQLKRLKRPT